ncbi:MAG: hypothetical protein JWP97_1929 [Labilithrix sp.]|nr:hypothetical protein [Labilithrix sp.]
MTTISSKMAIMAMGLVACSDASGAPATPAGTERATDGGGAFASGTELRVTVPASGRAYVKLATAAQVSTTGAADWDLAFEGLDVFTNGGISGPGEGASFGPLDAAVFLGDGMPVVPFTTADEAGGAFLDWYAYEGDTHALWSRQHVFGVKDGGRLWKVQILTYYGERDGAVIAALYGIRYAELTGGALGDVKEVTGLDATAGGTAAPATTKSECLDLGTGARTMHAPDDAARASDWHLCFRRDSITVNGEIGGPRGVGAVDLGADGAREETVESVKAIAPEVARASFDAVTAASFEGRSFRGDHVVSGFGAAWLDGARTPLAPSPGAWLVVDAGGRPFLLGFLAFENPTTRSPGTVVMRIKPVKG